MSRRNNCNLSIEATHWIDGELLGDGCLHKISPRSAIFVYASKYQEYIEYVRDTLKSFGIEQAGKINRYYNILYHILYHNTNLLYSCSIFSYKFINCIGGTCTYKFLYL